MSETVAASNVLQLQKKEADPQIVKALEELLEAAKKGDISAIVVTWYENENIWSRKTGHWKNTTEELGFLEMQKLDFYKMSREQS